RASTKRRSRPRCRCSSASWGSTMTQTHDERRRRWRLALGGEDNDGLSERDGESGGKRRGGLGASAPRVSRWLGDIREFFPASVVQVIQRDAFERLGLKQMLLEPEFMVALTPDVHLVA